jgi:hypothetical protein
VAVSIRRSSGPARVGSTRFFARVIGKPARDAVLAGLRSLTVRFFLAAVVALVMAVAYCAPAQAAAKSCVGAEEARAHAAGDSGGAALKFTAPFYKRLFLLNVSLDGADGSELPISIEEVCSVPRRLKKQAAQLAGGDGVALLLPRTTVWQGGTQLTGEAATTAIDGADTAVLRVRLVRPPTIWSQDEDGNPVPTFRTGRMEITD